MENLFLEKLKSEVQLKRVSDKAKHTLTDKDGNVYIGETEKDRIIDRRKFIRNYYSTLTMELRVTSGLPKAFVWVLIKDRALEEGYLGKIKLTYQDMVEICNRRDVKPLTKSQLSKGLKWHLDEGTLVKGKQRGIYYYDVSLIYAYDVVKYLERVEPL